MACGKPVVGTRLNNGVDFVNEDGKIGRTVPPGDPVALAGALREVLDNRAKATQWGAAGKAKALAEFSLDQMTERMLGIYRIAVDGS
jgi:rhamnosyl/mannosyltransferase